jgi:hypothetical protein
MPGGYSMCGSRYLLALSNPWHPEAAGACVPKFPSRPSQKVTAFLRCTPVTNSFGQAYVLISPNLANDGAFAYYTASNLVNSSGFAIVSSGTGTTSTTGVQVAKMSTLPFTTSQLTNSNVSGSAAVGRLISVGASIQCIQAASNVGGLYTLYEEPCHDNVNGQSFTGLQSKRECVVKRITQEKEWINLSPTNESELEYANGQYLQFSGAGTMPSIYPWSGSEYLDAAASTNTYLNGAAPAVILITGAPGSTAFNVEIIAHFEYVGISADVNTTPNSIDTKAVNDGMAAAQKAQGTRNDSSSTYAQSFMRGLKEVIKEAAPLGRDILKSYTRSHRRNSYAVEL